MPMGVGSLDNFNGNSLFFTNIFVPILLEVTFSIIKGKKLETYKQPGK